MCEQAETFFRTQEGGRPLLGGYRPRSTAWLLALAIPLFAAGNVKMRTMARAGPDPYDNAPALNTCRNALKRQLVAAEVKLVLLERSADRRLLVGGRCRRRDRRRPLFDCFDDGDHVRFAQAELQRFAVEGVADVDQR